jgi:hypothetical protein
MGLLSQNAGLRSLTDGSFGTSWSFSLWRDRSGYAGGACFHVSQ